MPAVTMLCLSLALILLFTTINGQQPETSVQDICNFDPDVIFFDNEELEKLRKSFTFGGECSPAFLKGEFDRFIDNNRFSRAVGELSRRDQHRLETSINRRMVFDNQNPNFESRPEYFFGGHDLPWPQDEGSRPEEELRRPSQGSRLFGKILSEKGRRPNGIRRPGPINPRKPDVFRPEGDDYSDFNAQPGNPPFRPQALEFPEELFRPQTTTPRTSTLATPTTTLPGPPTWATPPSRCVQRCPNTPEYNPICGTDNVTYNNPGRLRCQRQCGSAGVQVRYYGACREGVVDSALINRSS